MNSDQHEALEIATDMMYIGLFGAGARALRKRLGLPLLDTPHDENLRNHMGLEAVRALCDIETKLADWLSQSRSRAVSYPNSCMQRSPSSRRRSKPSTNRTQRAPGGTF